MTFRQSHSRCSGWSRSLGFGARGAKLTLTRRRFLVSQQAMTQAHTSLVRPAFVVWPLLLAIFFFLDLIKSLCVIPIPSGDAIHFYPIYLSVANNGALYNPLISPIVPAGGGGPLTWHGWLQPMLLGYLTKLFGDGMSAALLSEIIVKQTGLFIYLAAIWRSKKADDVIAILGSIIIYVSLTASQGRPELLASVFLLGWWFLDAGCENLHSRAVVAGMFLGLLGTTQPTVAAISSGLFMVALLLSCMIGEALKVWVIANSCALLIIAATTSLIYPFGILEWIDGLLRQAAFSAVRGDKEGFFHYWILSRERPLHGIIVIVAAAALGWATLMRGMRSGAAIVYCLTMGFVWYVSVRIPATVYNAMAFVPVLVALGADRLSRYQVPWRWALTLGAGALAASSVAAIVVTAISVLDGRDAATAYRDLKSLSEESELVIVLPPDFLIGVIPFSEWKRYRVSYDVSGCPPGGKAVAVKQQANSGLFAPRILKGCDLIADSFANPIEIHGWRIPLVPQSYGYAVYRRPQ
jgi:hypothetical protein